MTPTTAIPITGLRALEDNYIWVMRQAEHLWVVDPGEAQPVLAFLHKTGTKLAGILVTHHHWDHTQGIAELKHAFPECEVIASEKTHQTLPELPISHQLKQGDKVAVAGTLFEVIEIPGHTLDHIAFFNQGDGKSPILFCGDTLFTAGCGRVFEGTAEQMANSLLTLRHLPEQTLIYCGHEYTLANINFAAIAEPENPAIQQRRQQVIERTLKGQPNVPETLAVEKATNPFLRFDLDPLKQTLYNKQSLCFTPAKETLSKAELFAITRAWKDQLDATGELERIAT
ncbi:hydroxyacylglutathione hydrolase [Galenea microaerophila]